MSKKMKGTCAENATIKVTSEIFRVRHLTAVIAIGNDAITCGVFAEPCQALAISSYIHGNYYSKKIHAMITQEMDRSV